MPPTILDLDQENRYQIYEYFASAPLFHGRRISYIPDKLWLRNEALTATDEARRDTFKIAATCKKVRSEILCRYFSTNVFSTCIHEGNFNEFWKFIHVIARDHAQRINDIEFEIDDCENLPIINLMMKRELLLSPTCKFTFVGPFSQEMKYSKAYMEVEQRRNLGFSWSEIAAGLDNGGLMSSTFHPEIASQDTNLQKLDRFRPVPAQIAIGEATSEADDSRLSDGSSIS